MEVRYVFFGEGGFFHNGMVRLLCGISELIRKNPIHNGYFASK